MASHGGFAAGALDGLQMIVGAQENVGLLSIFSEEDPGKAEEKLSSVVESLDVSGGLVILADLLGGTPCNVACRFAARKENTWVYSGFNLPVLIELFMNRRMHPGDAGKHLEKIFQGTFVNVLEFMRQQTDED